MTPNDRARAHWLVPPVPAVLGAVILVAEAADGQLGSGLAWFAVLAAISALGLFGGRLEAVRLARGDDEDERDAMINTSAMAIAGIVLVVALTAGIVYELARGRDPSPYVELMAIGGASYALALLVLRRRS
jgi:hypothetical protein